MTATPRAPQIGDRVIVRGHVCEVIVMRPAGTIDVSSTDSDHAWRVSGSVQLVKRGEQ